MVIFRPAIAQNPVIQQNLNFLLFVFLLKIPGGYLQKLEWPSKGQAARIECLPLIPLILKINQVYIIQSYPPPFSSFLLPDLMLYRHKNQ